MRSIVFILAMLHLCACSTSVETIDSQVLTPDYVIPRDQEHFAFSRTIPAVIRVPSGAIIEVHTKEASNGLVRPGMTSEEYRQIVWPDEFGHPLTGPVFVEGAEPGDILAVTLHHIKLRDWGWTDSDPHWAYLGDELDGVYLKTYKFSENGNYAQFSDDIAIPLQPFPGVMGVAPDTDEMLSTIPPRANGGNMDDPNIIQGTTVYFPVFVKGALFSIGDTHAAQGHGEVSGTAIEAPMHITFEVNVLKDSRRISEPQYESDDFYAVTAFALTLDEAAKKATRFMIDYLMEEQGLQQHEANMLCSAAADLKIAEVVDENVLVSMHISKSLFKSVEDPHRANRR